MRSLNALMKHFDVKMKIQFKIAKSDIFRKNLTSYRQYRHLQNYTFEICTL